MIYQLPDGRTFETEEVSRVSSLRDLGLDESTIDKSVLAFTIKLKNGFSIQVMKYYHYNDWSEVVHEMKILRNEILSKVDKT